jgi:putative ABC transport system ATP-binding protein
MIRLESLHVLFYPGSINEKKALKGIDLTIHEGDFITVVGSNGAGKSTLLNVISGEIPPSSGNILINDKNVSRDPTFKRAVNVARVFQDPLVGTCGELSIAENLCLALKRGQKRPLLKALSTKTKKTLQEMVKALNLGLESRLDTPMGLLSGGQRQAVSLLMATLSPLQILLLDEHTSALDPKTAAFIMELSQTLIQERNLTTLMVTHSLHHALDYGNRTLMLHDGQIIYDVSGPERKSLTVQDLLKKFDACHVDDDRLLLQQ